MNNTMIEIDTEASGDGGLSDEIAESHSSTGSDGSLDVALENDETNPS